MKYIIGSIFIIIGIFISYMLYNSKQETVEQRENNNSQILQDNLLPFSPENIEKDLLQNSDKEEIILSQFNPDVAAQAEAYLLEEDTQMLYESIFEIEDELVRREVLLQLFYRIGDNDDAASMFISLILARIETDLVVDTAQMLTFEEADRVYSEVRDLLTEDQRKVFLTQYSRSAALNEDEFVPFSLQEDMEAYGIETDRFFLYDTIVSLSGPDYLEIDQSYRDDPKNFENFSQIPKTGIKGELVTWWYAFRKIYIGTSQEIELTEKLRYDESMDYSWLIEMSMDELSEAYFDYRLNLIEKEL